MAAWQSYEGLQFMFCCMWGFNSGSVQMSSNFYVDAKYIPRTKVDFKKEYKDNTQSQSYEYFYTSVPSESVDRKDFSNDVNDERKDAFRFNIHESEVQTSLELNFYFFHEFYV